MITTMMTTEIITINYDNNREIMKITMTKIEWLGARLTYYR